MTSDTLDPCGSFFAGECEDYNIRITNDQEEINTFCYPFFLVGLTTLLLIHSGYTILLMKAPGIIVAPSNPIRLLSTQPP